MSSGCAVSRPDASPRRRQERGLRRRIRPAVATVAGRKRARHPPAPTRPSAGPAWATRGEPPLGYGLPRSASRRASPDPRHRPDAPSPSTAPPEVRKVEDRLGVRYSSQTARPESRRDAAPFAAATWFRALPDHPIEHHSLVDGSLVPATKEAAAPVIPKPLLSFRRRRDHDFWSLQSR